MQVGKLRDLITVQTYADTIAANGETTKSWTTFAQVFAEIRPVSGREYMQGEKVQGDVSHVIYIRHLPGLLNKMRITDGTRIFQIMSALPDRTNNKMMTIYANEKMT